MRQQSLFDGIRTTLDDSVQQSLDSLRAYGERYQHWAVAYSGGKDSTATVTFVAWALANGLIPRPATLTVLYADTRQELTPLHAGAMQLMARLRATGLDARVVLPALDDRFYVYMLGRGVPPPSNRFRWCTPKIKIEPMERELYGLGVAHGLGHLGEDGAYHGFGHAKLLMLTGVRLGESAARDARIAVSCSKDSGECGQGWMQVNAPTALCDTLAPLLHWRLCHVYDWLYFDFHQHGYNVDGIAAVYGEDDVRTGCTGCPLASRDTALERVVKLPEWSHLSPLLELKALFRELKLARWRKRKTAAERRTDGSYNKNVQRMGPLTMEGRAYGLERVLDIQRRAGVDLINAEEEARIREMWALDIWPQKWSADDIDADVPIDAVVNVAGELVTQPLLVR